MPDDIEDLAEKVAKALGVPPHGPWTPEQIVKINKILKAFDAIVMLGFLGKWVVGFILAAAAVMAVFREWGNL